MQRNLLLLAMSLVFMTGCGWFDFGGADDNPNSPFIGNVNPRAMDVNGTIVNICDQMIHLENESSDGPLIDRFPPNGQFQLRPNDDGYLGFYNIAAVVRNCQAGGSCDGTVAGVAQFLGCVRDTSANIDFCVEELNGPGAATSFDGDLSDVSLALSGLVYWEGALHQDSPGRDVQIEGFYGSQANEFEGEIGPDFEAVLMELDFRSSLQVDGTEAPLPTSSMLSLVPFWIETFQLTGFSPLPVVTNMGQRLINEIDHPDHPSTLPLGDVDEDGNPLYVPCT